MKHVSDLNHKELTPSKVLEIFTNEYINREDRFKLEDASFKRLPQSATLGDNGMEADVVTIIDGKSYELKGKGNGRLDAIMNALRQGPYKIDCDFVTYEEHALESESNSRAAAYVAMADKNGNTYWGVGIHNDIIYASIKALMSAINRGFAKKEDQEER